MKNKFRFAGLLFAFIFFYSGVKCYAQENEVKLNQIIISGDTIKRPLSELSLIELAQLKVSVASKNPQTQRESPGIVTLITKEDIMNSGARDLIDVLRLVPGIEFGADVRGITSIGMRGQWAHEGKILLLWDGLIMNDLLYQSLQIGSRYPVDLIERIEVMRGPGSSIYGGMAELGVINIITSPTQRMNKTTASSTLGWMAKTFGRQNFTISLSEKKQDISFDLSLHAGSANRSDQTMTDYHLNNPYHIYDMSDQSPMRSVMINGGFNIYGLKSRLLINKYAVNDRTMYGSNLNSAPEINFNTYIFDLLYDYQVNDKLSFTPRLNFTKSSPYRCVDKNYPIPIYLDKNAERYTASVIANYQITTKINYLFGMEWYTDKGIAGDSTYFKYDPSRKELSYTNFAVFGQGLFLNDITDLTLGGRFETNSESGNSFVPRIGLTKIIDAFHLKALYSLAFHSPGLENISRYTSSAITAEKTSVIEFEAGYQLSQILSVSANVFDMTMTDPIVFLIDPLYKRPAYHNGTRTRTWGIETEVRLKTKQLNATLTYSFYQADRNEIGDYAVAENDKVLLAFPQHKITLNSNYYVTPEVTINLSAAYLSERWADNNVTKTQYKTDPKLLVNIFVNYKKFLVDGMSVGVGVYDVFDARYSFIQPYNGGDAPLPGPSREFTIKFSYNKDFY